MPSNMMPMHHHHMMSYGGGVGVGATPYNLYHYHSPFFNQASGGGYQSPAGPTPAPPTGPYASYGSAAHAGEGAPDLFQGERRIGW